MEKISPLFSYMLKMLHPVEAVPELVGSIVRFVIYTNSFP